MIKSTDPQRVMKALQTWLKTTYASEVSIREDYTKLPRDHGNLPHAFNVLTHPAGWVVAVANNFFGAGPHEVKICEWLSEIMETTVLVEQAQSTADCFYLQIWECGSLRRKISADEYGTECEGQPFASEEIDEEFDELYDDEAIRRDLGVPSEDEEWHFIGCVSAVV